VKSAETHLLERIEHAATAGPGAESVECLITHDFSNTGTVYVRHASENTTLFAIAFNFQANYCTITLCGEVFEQAAPPVQGDRGPSYRVETVATHRDLPKPQLVFGVLRFSEDERIEGMLDMIAAAVALTLAQAPIDTAPSLLITASEIAAALDGARRALEGTSNDAEHDALYELAETLDGWLSPASAGTRVTSAVSNSRVVAATQIGELLLDAAERHGVNAAAPQAFVRALARSDLDGLARSLVDKG
jgi:hypothetical protein